MKINELVNEINCCTSFKAIMNEENKRLVVLLGDNSIFMTIKYNVEYLEDIDITYACLDYYEPCGNLGNFYALMNLVNEFVNTPVEKREPKYRIADRIQVSIAGKVQLPDESKCPVCQEHHNVWGLTDAFDLRIKDDLLLSMDKSVRNDTRYPKEVFKISYCPFCGRPLNEEEP